ncbi:hypothetical protein [Nonomuraea sp. NPDC003709]
MAVDDTYITVHDNGEPIRIVPRTTTRDHVSSSLHPSRLMLGSRFLQLI